MQSATMYLADVVSLRRLRSVDAGVLGRSLLPVSTVFQREQPHNCCLGILDTGLFQQIGDAAGIIPLTEA